MKLEDEVRDIIGCRLQPGSSVLFSAEHRALVAIAKAYDDLRIEIGMPPERPTAQELAELLSERDLEWMGREP